MQGCEYDIVALLIEEVRMANEFDLISRKLDTLEAEQSVRVLYAVDTEPDNKMPWSRLNAAFLEILAHED